MKKSRAKKRAKPDSSDAPASHAERVETVRQQIFKAMGVISVARLGSASMFEAEDRSDDFASALAVAHDLLDDAATELEGIASNRKRAAPS